MSHGQRHRKFIKSVQDIVRAGEECVAGLEKLGQHMKKMRTLNFDASCTLITSCHTAELRKVLNRHPGRNKVKQLIYEELRQRRHAL